MRDKNKKELTASHKPSMSAANHNLTDSARLAAPKGGFGFKSELRDADKAHSFVFPRTRGNWDSFMGEVSGRKMGLPSDESSSDEVSFLDFLSEERWPA
jgi:hypothetical protein